DPATVFENRWRWFRRRVADAARFGTRALQRPWWRRWHDQGEDDLLGLAPWLLVIPFAPAVQRLASLGALATVFLRAGAVTFGGGGAHVRRRRCVGEARHPELDRRRDRRRRPGPHAPVAAPSSAGPARGRGGRGDLALRRPVRPRQSLVPGASRAPQPRPRNRR